MKKSALVLLLFLSFGDFSIAAEKPLGVETFTSVGAFANAVVSYFPKVQGPVKAVQGDLLTVGLGAKDGLKAGVTLVLWRDGKEILHPVTGAVIGRAEEEIGEAEVIDAGAATTELRIIKRLKDPRPGDKARITPKKIGLALLPLRGDRPDIVRELADRLNDSGRFSVLDIGKTADFLKDRKQRDSSLIKELGRAFGLDMVAALEMYPSEQGKLLMTVKLFYSEDARTLDTITALLDLTTKQDSFGEVKPFFAPAVEEKNITAGEKAVSANLPIDAKLIAVADLEGSGALNYVFSDGAKLHIYRLEQTAWREEWSGPAVSGSGDIQHINLDVADINGNGRPELFVTAMRSDEVVSAVIEFQEGAFRRIAEVPGFLRVVYYPGKGNLLIGQGYDPRSFFKGKPRRYSWADGKYIPGPEFPLPEGLELYGFTYALMGEAKPLLIALNDKEQLVVYSNDSAIWKSEEKYPSVGMAVTKPLTGVEAAFLKEGASAGRDAPPVVNREEIKIKGRILTFDMNGDGRDEIVLPKNLKSTLTGFAGGGVSVLRWTGSRLEQQLSIKDVPGLVLDLQALRESGGDVRIAALVFASGGLFKSDTVRLISYAVK